MSTTPIYNMTDTWNDVSTSFTAVKMDVTDTASADGSLLLDLAVSGTSKFTVDKDGFISDALFGIADNSDRTKRVRFQVSGVTTGTARTKTFQDLSGTIYETGGQDVSVADGGTGASTAAAALANLGVAYIKHVAVGEDIQAAIDAVGSLGGGIVQLSQGVHEITSKISIGDGASGSASSYNNVILRGCGAAPLDSSNSGTEIRWTGTTSSSNIMVEVAGRSSGMGVQDVYLNANDKAGDCLVIKSNIYGQFKNVLGLNYLRRGCHLTIQASPASAAWYSTTNVFERCAFLETTNPNTQAWRLEGTNDGFLNDPHRNTFIGCQGASARSLDASHTPCALYLGYTDSNTFVECDFQLDSLTEDAIVNDRQALLDANGSSYTNGDIIKVRYYGTAPGDSQPNNVRYEVYYQYDSASTATGDNDDVIEPADSNGRFLRYQGAAVALDATVRNSFPQNIFFNNCAIIKDPSFEDWSTGGNIPGNATNKTPSVCLVAQALADAEDVPIYIPRAVGITDGMKIFNALTTDALVRGDAVEVGCEQDNQSRKFFMRLNADSDTGGGSSGNFGGFIAIAERASDQVSYSTVGRINMSRAGDWSPNGSSQDLGLIGTPWDVVYANTVDATDVNADRATLTELTAAPGTPVEGMIAYADGATWDPLDANINEVVPYLTQYRNSAWRDIQPGLRVYSLSIANNAAVSFTPPGIAGFLEAQLKQSTSRYGHARWSVGAGAQMVSITAGANLTFTTGALAGTTGTAGHVTVSSHTDGKIYVENQSGSTNTVTIWLRYDPD